MRDRSFLHSSFPGGLARSRNFFVWRRVSRVEKREQGPVVFSPGEPENLAQGRFFAVQWSYLLRRIETFHATPRRPRLHQVPLCCRGLLWQPPSAGITTRKPGVLTRLDAEQDFLPERPCRLSAVEPMRACSGPHRPGDRKDTEREGLDAGSTRTFQAMRPGRPGGICEANHPAAPAAARIQLSSCRATGPTSSDRAV